MARLARSESPAGYYHVMVRGNNRETIFKKAAEKRYFIELLQHTVEDNKITVVACCLMESDFSLILYAEVIIEYTSFPNLFLPIINLLLLFLTDILIELLFYYS